MNYTVQHFYHLKLYWSIYMKKILFMICFCLLSLLNLSCIIKRPELCKIPNPDNQNDLDPTEEKITQQNDPIELVSISKKENNIRGNEIFLSLKGLHKYEGLYATAFYVSASTLFNCHFTLPPVNYVLERSEIIEIKNGEAVFPSMNIYQHGFYIYNYTFFLIHTNQEPVYIMNVDTSIPSGIGQDTTDKTFSKTIKKIFVFKKDGEPCL